MFSPSEIRLSPSRFLLIYLAGSHLLAALITVRLSLEPLPGGLLLLLLLGSFWRLWRRAYAQSEPDSVTALRWDADRRRLSLCLQAGGWHRAERIQSAVALPWVVVLVVRLRRRYLPQAVVVMRDATDADSFRRLRVLVNFAAYLPAASAAEASDPTGS